MSNIENFDVYKKVICLNNKEIFETPDEASVFAETDSLDIIYCCKDINSYAGSINDEKLAWRYYKDFLEMSSEAIDTVLNNARNFYPEEEAQNKVVCINDKEVFDDLDEASEKTGLSKTSIRNCCNKKTTYSTDKEGNRFVFRYYLEYISLKEEEIQSLLDNLQKVQIKKVIYLETKKVYNSAEDASNEFGISPFTIRQQCNKKEYYSKKTMESGPSWMYYEEYLDLNKSM